MGGVGQHRAGEGALLLAALLVAHVEQVLQVRMRLEQAIVEALDDRVTMHGQDGRSGLDSGDRRRVEHGWSPYFWSRQVDEKNTDLAVARPSKASLKLQVRWPTSGRSCRIIRAGRPRGEGRTSGHT